MKFSHVMKKNYEIFFAKFFISGLAFLGDIRVEKSGTRFDSRILDLIFESG